MAPDTRINVRTTRPGKYLRADYADGSSRILVNFVAKDESKTQVVVQHERLAEAAAIDPTKAFWRDRMAALKAVLEGGA